MRIVHTSDWHAGRVWKRIDRLPELADVLENLGDFLERKRIDLLLMSGDVFDSGAPNPAAERLVFGFLKRIGRAGIKSVVIAGNHDSPARLQAWGTLAELVDVQAVAFPCRVEDGGLVEVETRSGERALVAAVPFAAPRRLVSALDLSGEQTQVKQKYDQGMKQIIAHLVSGFDVETVNLVMAHTHLQGAVLSGSERLVHLGEEWATTPQAFPSTAHYVALGHIHKPQNVEAAPAPTHYAGSPLQLDFGEAGEEKSFLLIDARPREPARIDRIPYQGGLPLRSVRKGLEELEREAARLSAKGWLRVKVPLKFSDPDVNSKVRRLIPNVVAVEIELPERAEGEDDSRPPRGSPPRELYQAYFQNEHGSEPEQGVVEAFDRLLADADRGTTG
jgi:exonuclease SbcD